MEIRIFRHILPALLLLGAAAFATVSCNPAQSGDEPDGPEIIDEPEENTDFLVKDGIMSEEVLCNYLSRAMSHASFCASKITGGKYSGINDDERMVLNVGAKFIGRALGVWGTEQYFKSSYQIYFDYAKEKIDRMHSKDPDIIFQAAIFEIVSTRVNDIPIPAWVFEAFGKPAEERNFDYNGIMNRNHVYEGQWGDNTCVPDMSREEAQMWFYYCARRYIDAGFEAIHCGQVNLMASMGDAAAGYPGFRKLFGLIRTYAKEHARRGFVLLDAHTDGIVVDGTSLLDYAAYPLRLVQVRDGSMGDWKYPAKLQIGYSDSIEGRTPACKTPMGWSTERLPYFVEFDNYGTTDKPGQYSADGYHVWGFDEISWFANCEEEYQKEFIRYAVNWFKENDPMGHLEMPGLRLAVGAFNPDHDPYRCNNTSEACPNGRGLEDTIKELFEND
ncbi:MAG: hypothetical protein MJY56_00565 [Bacteroidales bacterium]|nr:hypothetical protein [Bacteroidales bacterium]